MRAYQQGNEVAPLLGHWSSSENHHDKHCKSVWSQSRRKLPLSSSSGICTRGSLSHVWSTSMKNTQQKNWHCSEKCMHFQTLLLIKEKYFWNWRWVLCSDDYGTNVTILNFHSVNKMDCQWQKHKLFTLYLAITLLPLRKSTSTVCSTCLLAYPFCRKQLLITWLEWINWFQKWLKASQMMFMH